MKLRDFTGARRIPFVGRSRLLEEIEKCILRGGAHVFYFEGDGGIGKTALLQAALAQTMNDKEEGHLLVKHVADQIIDLYHADAHTPEGLIRHMIQVLGPQSFPQVHKILRRLDRARRVGNVEEANEQARRLLSTFTQEFTALAADGVVLALDTLEILEYERDPFQKDLGEAVPILSAGEWLFRSFFPALKGNFVLLLAGRPSGMPGTLDALQEQNPAFHVRHVVLESLSEEEIQAYLQSVAAAEAESGDRDAAERLWAFCQERVSVVHLLTGGRPILLALVADMIAHGWTLPPAFGRSLEELKRRDAHEWRQEIEWALIVRIQESPTPIGDVVYALAWLRKGATSELLARVMALVTPDGKWDVDTAQKYLEEVAQLTLIKVRPGEGRVFLHDEMYALLERYVLQACDQSEHDRVYEAILEYYQDQIEDLEDRIEQSSAILTRLHSRLREIYVEELHYRLRHRPPLGFADYFWRAEQALDGGDVELDMLLRTELLRTFDMLRRSDLLAGLRPEEVEMDIAVRWGMRTLFSGNDPDKALDIFGRIERQWQGRGDVSELTRAHLRLYQAVAKILRGEEDDWRVASRLLKDVESQVQEIVKEPAFAPSARGLFRWLRTPQSPPAASVLEAQRWRARVLQTAALNYQGYLDRQQGRYTGAVRHYQKSAMLQRRLGMSGLAPVLVNLSYAMALTGEFRHARLLAEEAERWARRTGRDHMWALVLNARALVETHDNHHQEALRLTAQALDVSQGLRAHRVRGLIYLTRARAHRYLLVSLTEEGQPYDPALLGEILKDGNRAVNLLRNNPPDRVGALIERGCLHREIARSAHLRRQEVNATKSIRESQQDLERAATLAGAMDLPDQEALAWINLGWLWYYVGQADQAQAALAKAYAPIPTVYCFPAQGSLPLMAEETRKAAARLPFWSTLGKAEMLKAYVALDATLALPENEDRASCLLEAVRHITLALAYDELLADEYFAIFRAEESLHRRILTANLNIGDLHQNALLVAQEQELAQPTRFQAFLERMFGPADLWT